MRKSFSTGLAMGALMAMAPVTLSAQAKDASKSDMLKMLYAKLAHLVTGGDPKSDSLLILSAPGFSVPTVGLDSTNKNDMVFLMNTLNEIPKPSRAYSSSKLTYSGVYGKILTSKEIDKVPLTPAEAAELKTCMELTSKSNPKMVEYMKFKKLANAAQRAVNTATNKLDKKKGEQVDSVLLSDVQDANREWITDGYKNEIDAALLRVREISSKDGTAFWTDLYSNWEAMNTKKTSGTPTVETYPPPGNWGTKDGDGAATSSWTTFTWKSSERLITSGFSSKELEAATSYSSGAISIAASGGFSKTNEEAAYSDAKMEITVDLMRVGVYRSWLDMSIFEMGSWTYNGVISNGDPLDPSGDMPVMINEIWLAKNLRITGEWATKYAQAKKLAVHAELQTSIGPFNLAAKYAQTDSSKIDASADGSEGILNPDVQVIGFICSYVPKAPKKK